MENSVYDHRVDDLLRVMDEIFDVLARLWSSAVGGRRSVQPAGRRERVTRRRRSGGTSLPPTRCKPSIRVPPLDGLRAARDVSHALGEWHRAGAVAGDVAFWAPHVQSLESPKPYALIVETLLSTKRLCLVAVRAGPLAKSLGDAATWRAAERPSTT